MSPSRSSAQSAMVLPAISQRSLEASLIFSPFEGNPRINLLMITAEPVLAYLHEVVFPRYYPNRPTGLEATLTADTICLDPARNRSAPLMLRTGGAYADLPPRPISFCELLGGQG